MDEKIGHAHVPDWLTNTHSVGVVRDALVSNAITSHQPDDLYWWALPVVGETYDGLLNDINGQHVKAEHVAQALASASSGQVAEGGVGSGTGMVCHGFKGGIGTASRVVPEASGSYTVGVLVQANHGRRERLQIKGVPVGDAIPVSEVPAPEVAGFAPQGGGSIIVIVATNAPLIPTQCTRLAQRAGLGSPERAALENTGVAICFSPSQRRIAAYPPANMGPKAL